MLVPILPFTRQRANAIHEAAHAVVAIRRGIGVRSVELTHPSSGMSGLCLLAGSPSDTVAGLWSLAVIAAAGAVATVMIGDIASEIEADDVEKIGRIQQQAARLAPWFAFPSALAAARKMLTDPATWASVVRVADALEVFGKLDGRQAASITAIGAKDWELIGRIRDRGPAAVV